MFLTDCEGESKFYVSLLFQHRAIAFDQAPDSGAAYVSHAAQVDQEVDLLVLSESLHHIIKRIRPVTRIQSAGYLNDSH